jgi:hypothetical protein
MPAKRSAGLYAESASACGSHATPTLPLLRQSLALTLARRSPTAAAALPCATVDLTGVVATLESHWVVLDAELSEIKKDYLTLRNLTRKHGEFWNRPMAQLKKLRTQKENLLKE